MYMYEPNMHSQVYSQDEHSQLPNSRVYIILYNGRFYEWFWKQGIISDVLREYSVCIV